MLNINNEIWKPVIGFEGRYEVSNQGRIKSIIDNHGKPKSHIKSVRIRSESCKYLYVQFFIKDKVFHEAVHRVVAKAFIKNKDNKPMVNHINGDKLKNDAYNLEWVTCSENHKHAFEIGLRDIEKHRERMIGTKYGKSSHFRNVTYDPSRNKWKGTMKHMGKMLPQKRFDTEIEAAQYVNYLIDLYKINRPKNIID